MDFRKSTFSLLVILVSYNAFSQAVYGEPSQYESSWRNLQVIRNILNTSEKSNPVKFEDIKGSPYYDENFKRGEFFVDSQHLGNFYLRYNIYSDEIEVIDDNQLENLGTNNLKLESFLRLDKSKAVIEGRTFELYTFRDDKSYIKKGYFIELLQNEKYTLLQRKRCTLTPAQKAPTFNQADRAAKFNIYDDYYLLTEGVEYPIKLESNKNKIAKLFPEKESQIKTFIKKQKINLKESSGIIKLINYVSSI